MVEQKFQEGLAHQRAGRLADAQKSYRQVLKDQPRHFGALYLSGILAIQTEHFPQAVEFFDKALAADRNSAEAYYNRGIALWSLGKYQPALGSYDKALALNPNYVVAHNNRGLVLSALKQHQTALTCYDQALTLKPDYPEALNNRGVALRELKQYHAAIESFDAALRYAPSYADAYYNRGAVLALLEAYPAAVENFDRAVQFKGDFAEAYAARGAALRELKNPAAAVSSYDKAVEINPNLPFLMGARLHAKMQVCDWRDVDRHIADLSARIKRGDKAAASTSVLALTDDLTVQRKAAETWVADKEVAAGARNPIPQRAQRDKIRVGYFSMDFREHPVASLMVGLIEAHDRQKFEVYGFAYGRDTQDETRKRLEAGFDRFCDVSGTSDADAAALARELGIDIAVDLAGHTGDARTEILALGAAPIQVNYLGYPGTMGADYIDYIIADSTLIPEKSRKNYAEKIVTLPHSYQVNDPKRRIADTVFARAALGLPETGFVFCCFNNNYKILPATFDVWMRLLKRVDGSVLWLFEDNPGAADNLRKEAERRGVNGARLVFATRMSRPEHLARHRAADLFLDTLPYNAHTTASDALWAGLPVLTCQGESFAGRVAASLLTAIGLPELITSTPEAYEALAVDLATDPQRLAALKQKLADHRLTYPLFDLALFTRHIEAAYTQMIARHHAGLAPDHIAIKA